MAPGTTGGAARASDNAAVAVRRDDGWELLEAGADEPERRVLLLPANMATAEFFRGMLADPALAQAGVRAVAATPPGFGGLPSPPDLDFTIASYAELIERWVVPRGFDLVVGHSLSANALIEVAARGVYEGGLVLIGPTLRASNEVQAARTLDRMSRIPVLSSATWLGMMLGLGVGMRGELPDERRSELVAEMRRNRIRANRRWLVAGFDQLASGHDLVGTLAAATNRVWLVRGQDDPIAIDPDDRATLAAAGIEITEVPGARHFVMTQCPHETNAVVLSAVASLGH